MRGLKTLLGHLCHKMRFKMRTLAGLDMRRILKQVTFLIPAADAITAKIDLVYFDLSVIKMPHLFENPANCKLQAVIRFLNDRSVKPVDCSFTIS